MGEAAAQPHAAAAKKSTTARRPATLEEKRARQRAYVKKSYYRQQNTVHALKQQVRELEAEYRRLERAVALAQDPANKTPHADHNNATHEQNVLEDEQYLEELFAHKDAATTALTTAYAQLTLLKEELHRENRALVDAANEYDKFQYQLGLWVEAENGSHDTHASSSSRPRHSSRGRSKSAIHRPPPVLTRPFTVEECQKIASSCYAEVRAFLESNPFKSTGTNVFGWRDERRMLEDGSRFTYSLKKFFHGRTAAELSLGGWRINSTSRLRDFYAKSIDMEVHVLQQVDADNVIMYRVIHSSDGQFIDKTFFLTTRLRIETGYVILFRSLETEGRIVEYSESGSESPGAMDRDMNADVKREQERWVNLLTWVLFEEVGENAEHCLFNFGGMVPSSSAAWLLEILLVALRWENMVVGPVFAIC